MKILHVAGECYPLVKTGGLADVLGALPKAQAALGDDVRVVLPAYRGLRMQLQNPVQLASIPLRTHLFELIEGRIPDHDTLYWLVDCPALFDRPGGPYLDASGAVYADNAERFASFSEVVAQVALHGVTNWRPDIVHLHDWHTALVAAWLAGHPDRPSTVLTIHNLAYQGNFHFESLQRLSLPEDWWRTDLGEFWGQLSFLKAGISTADVLTTVSPTYAAEIRTPAFGHGMEGVLQQHGAKLHGILNGIDDTVWNPATDRLVAATYDAESVQSGKAANKSALQRALGLKPDHGALLIGIVSRLAQQKGMESIIEAAEQWAAMPVQLAVLGRGEPDIETGFSELARRRPGQIGLHLGFDERLAHLIEAGSDAFLMPSRFEPCGLNQMYSQKYGSIPLVRRTGGLADTVSDIGPTGLTAGRATGISFDESDASAIVYALRRALELFGTPTWLAMQQQGMATDFSWGRAATQYQKLYVQTLGGR